MVVLKSCALSAIFADAHSYPNRGYGCSRFGHFSPNPGAVRKWRKKYCASIRDWGLVDELDGGSTDGPHFRLDLPEIAGGHPSFLGATVQTIIPAKDGPNFTIIGPIRMWLVNGDKNGV